MMKAPCSQGNTAASLGKQSCLQRAKLGRDPAKNGEKSSNSLAIHLIETYPTNRTFRNETSLHLLLSGAMSIANFSRLQGDRSTQNVPPSAPYRTMAGNPALGWDRDTAYTILTPQTASHPGAAHCETHLTLLGESLLLKTTHMENNWSAQFSPRFCPPALTEKETMSMFEVGVEHILLPRNHTHISRLERTGTLKMHSRDTTVHPQASSSVARCL